MLFSSLLFLYCFLPFVLLGSILIQQRYRNKFLLVASLIFFAWGGVTFTFVFMGSVLMNYYSGILISKYENNLRRKKTVVTIAIILNLLFLCIFKYTGFAIENINLLFHNLGLRPIHFIRIVLPIGISFYTFHELSYIIDIYRGTTKVQRKLSDLGLYISFFPQLIAGPIVRYKDIAEQLTNRELSHTSFNNGMCRFLIGLGKKVLIANTLAVLADHAFSTTPGSLSATMAWLGIISYTFQIYFDFSGYSDMAIGLALVFGLRFKENFNFPYLAESIKDFWRRWHISLSTWFRDYLYIPLGGNREGKGKTYRNLIIVFFITGLWHGASWNFILWGFCHGAFIIIESLGFGLILEKLFRPLRIMYSYIIVLFAWVMFRADNITYAAQYYKVMLGMGKTSGRFFQTIQNEISREQIFVLIIAITGSFGLFNAISRYITYLRSKNSPAILNTIDVAKFAFSISMLIICTIYLISGSYNPFIYFRF
jgi:alginate O-acetyltransferase complex protein AlgI